MRLCRATQHKQLTDQPSPQVYEDDMAERSAGVVAQFCLSGSKKSLAGRRYAVAHSRETHPRSLGGGPHEGLLVIDPAILEGIFSHRTCQVSRGLVVCSLSFLQRQLSDRDSVADVLHRASVDKFKMLPRADASN